MMIGIPLAGMRVLVSSLVGLAHAAPTPTLVPASFKGGCSFASGVMSAQCVPNYIAYLIGTIFELTGAVFLLMVIVGGYQYVFGKATGGGGEEGKARVRFAIIGFLITALSFYIVDFILNALIP